MRAENGQLRPEKRTWRRATSADDAKLVLARGLLVIVRPMTGNPTRSTPLPSCMALFGRLPVDLYAILAVDQLWCSWVLTLHVYTCIVTPHETDVSPLLLRHASASRPGCNRALRRYARRQRPPCHAIHGVAASRHGPKPDHNGAGGGSWR